MCSWPEWHANRSTPARKYWSRLLNCVIHTPVSTKIISAFGSGSVRLFVNVLVVVDDAVHRAAIHRFEVRPILQRNLLYPDGCHTVKRHDLHLAEGNDVGTAHNPDLFTCCGELEKVSQASLGRSASYKVVWRTFGGTIIFPCTRKSALRILSETVLLRVGSTGRGHQRNRQNPVLRGHFRRWSRRTPALRGDFTSEVIEFLTCGGSCSEETGRYPGPRR